MDQPTPIHSKRKRRPNPPTRPEVIACRTRSLAEFLRLAGRPAEAVAAEHIATAIDQLAA